MTNIITTARCNGDLPGAGNGLRKRLLASGIVLAAVGLSFAAARVFPATVSPQDIYDTQNQQQIPSGTIRIRVRLIPVDVIATDSRGRPVTDLKQEDFEIYENGRLQEIRQFFVQCLTAAATQPQQSQDATSTQHQLLNPDLAPETGRTFLIVMSHGRHQTPFSALDTLIRFVRRDLAPQDRVALLAYNCITDFTTDHEQLARALERFKQYYEWIETWREERAYMLASVFPGDLIGHAPKVLYRLVHSSRQIQSQILNILPPGAPLHSKQVAAVRIPDNGAFIADRDRVTSILQHGIAFDLADSSGEFGSAVMMTALEQIESESLRLGLPADVSVRELEGSVEDMGNIFTGVEQLRYMEGEKHLLFFTEFGLIFPYGMKEYDDCIARFAADARVAIDTFQTGGLDGLILRSPSLSAALAQGKPVPTTQWGQWAGFSTIKNISQESGGRASVLQDIGKALNRMNETTRVEYLLSYYPKDDNWDGKYRQVEVKVKRPGVNVSYRHGYFARDAAEPYDREKIQTAARVSDAGASYLELSDIEFKVSTARETDAGGQSQLKVDLAIDPSNITFRDVDDRHVASLRIAIYYADGKQKQLGEVSQTMDLTLRNETYQRYLQSGVPYSTVIPPGASIKFLKVIVYDVSGDRTGSKVVAVR